MAAGAYIFGCEGESLTPDEAAFFRDADPLGFILFARNIGGPDQVRRLTGALREAVGRDAPILIDQEGGRVQRLGPPHWRAWPPPLDMAQSLATPEKIAKGMTLRYRIIGAELRAVGIDTNCAPLADIAGANTHPFLKNRCYGETVAEVVHAARAVTDAHLVSGVLPVLKHIPGHGRARVDSHLDLPTVTAPLAELKETDFAVFRALADVPLGMTAHVVYSDIDDRPATLSPTVIQMIRADMGFDGLLMTDDISMRALMGDVGALASESLRAGCDAVLHCNGEMNEMCAVAEASGALSETAALRLARALALRTAPDPVDIDAWAAEFEALLNG